jgi:hypothetical protein
MSESEPVSRIDRIEQKVDTLSASVDKQFVEVREHFVEQREYIEFAYDRLDKRMTEGFARLDRRITESEQRMTDGLSRLETKVDLLVGTRARPRAAVRRRARPPKRRR